MDWPTIAGKPLVARHVRLHSTASRRGRIRRGLPSHLFAMRNDKRRSFDRISQLPDGRQTGSNTSRVDAKGRDHFPQADFTGVIRTVERGYLPDSRQSTQNTEKAPYCGSMSDSTCRKRNTAG